VHVKDALELFVQIFDRPLAQLVQETAHIDPVIGVRIRATAGGNHRLSRLGTRNVESRVMIMLVAEHRAHLS